MGYNTTLRGRLTLSRPLTIAEHRLIEKLNQCELAFPYNGGYLDWEVGEDGTTIGHNGGEKSYEYVEALRWVIDKLLAKWGVLVNGTVEWSGEEQGDIGRIVVKDNVVTEQKAKVTFE